MEKLTSTQLFKVKQIQGFVNITLKGLRIIHNSEGVTEEEAKGIIDSALMFETDEDVINTCKEFFRENYNY
jgi:hypothetical protein